MNIFYKIAIDHVNFNYVSGWCHHRFQKNRPLVLQLYRKNELIAETNNDRFREDLKALRLHPTGNCGFEFVASTERGFSDFFPLVIRVKGAAGQVARLDHCGWSAQRHCSSRKSRERFHLRKKPAQTAVFMHIPKTAGTSFNTLAQTFFPRKSTISHIELIPEQDYRALADRHRYISGHLRYGLLRQYFQSEQTAFYTIIREPFGQLHSHLKWMVQTAENPDETFFKATNETIYRLGRKLANIDFSSIRSMEAFVNSLNDLEAAFLDNIQTRYFLEDQPLRVVEQDLDRAIANASIFHLIGTTEEYDQFVQRFKSAHCIRVGTDYNALNISRSTSLFDPKDKLIQEILKPLVRYDLKLYEILTAANFQQFD